MEDDYSCHTQVAAALLDANSQIPCQMMSTSALSVSAAKLLNETILICILRWPPRGPFQYKETISAAKNSHYNYKIDGFVQASLALSHQDGLILKMAIPTLGKTIFILTQRPGFQLLWSLSSNAPRSAFQGTIKLAPFRCMHLMYLSVRRFTVELWSWMTIWD